VAAGAVTEADLDKALRKTLEMRFITGQFDPPSANPWGSLPISTVNSDKHRALARNVVQRGEWWCVGTLVAHVYEWHFGAL
jgi:beta-glucosidase